MKCIQGNWNGECHGGRYKFTVNPGQTAFLKVKKGPIPAFFVYFRPFLIKISRIQIEKSVEGVLGTRTCSRMMVGAEIPQSYGGRLLI